MRNLVFPSSNDGYDVFISYSHNDKELALYLASFFETKCGLKCFLDSAVWHNADALLRVIDDKYCRNCKNKNLRSYNYGKRNFSTSHVHAILTTAIHEVINKSECCIVLESINSIPLKDGIEKQTLSPWIYEEITFIKGMMPNIPKRLRNKHFVVFSANGGSIFENKELQIKCNVDLLQFSALDANDINGLIGMRTSGLDKLYKEKGIINYR